MFNILYNPLLSDCDKVLQLVLITLSVCRKITHWDGMLYHHREHTHSYLWQFSVMNPPTDTFLGCFMETQSWSWEAAMLPAPTFNLQQRSYVHVYTILPKVLEHLYK